MEQTNWDAVRCLSSCLLLCFLLLVALFTFLALLALLARIDAIPLNSL